MCYQAWQPELNHQDLPSGRGELTPASCPLTCMWHAHTHTINNAIFKEGNGSFLSWLLLLMKFEYSPYTKLLIRLYNNILRDKDFFLSFWPAPPFVAFKWMIPSGRIIGLSLHTTSIWKMYTFTTWESLLDSKHCNANRTFALRQDTEWQYMWSIT